MAQPRLRQLNQEGATDGQAVIWNDSLSYYEPQDIVRAVGVHLGADAFSDTDETTADPGSIGDVDTLDFAVGEEMKFTVQIPPGWDGSSDLTIRIVYAMSSAEASKTVRIATEGTICDVTGNTMDTSTIAAANYDISPANDINVPHASAVIRTIDSANLSIRDFVVIKIARRTAAPSSEHGGDLRLLYAVAELDIDAGSSTDSRFPKGYISGCNLDYNSATQVDITTGLVRSDDDTHNINVTSTLTVNSATTGANGRDTGTVDIAWYYVWVIKNPSTGTVAGLISQSSTSPTMPAGYTKKCRVGVVYNSAATTAVFYRTEQTGKGASRMYRYTDVSTSITKLIGPGTATSYTNLDCSALIPPTANTGFIYVLNTVSDPASRVRCRPDTSTTSFYPPVYGYSSVVHEVPMLTSNVEYNVTSPGSAWIYVVGYSEDL